MSKNDEKRAIRCSFCGKHQDQVAKIIAGPGAYICNECVHLCMDILENMTPPEGQMIDPDMPDTIPTPREIKAYLEEKGHEVINIGTDTHDSCNYPEYGEKAGRMVAAGEADGGVLICGTGVGISIAANKVKGVRAAVCSEPVTARLVKEHNNANIIAFGARIVGSETAKAIVDAWLDAKFQGGRHQTRIDMIHKIEE